MAKHDDEQPPMAQGGIISEPLVAFGRPHIRWGEPSHNERIIPTSNVPLWQENERLKDENARLTEALRLKGQDYDLVVSVIPVLNSRIDGQKRQLAEGRKERRRLKALETLVARLAAMNCQLGDTFACSFCGAEPDETSRDRRPIHTPDCLHREARRLMGHSSD